MPSNPSEILNQLKSLNNPQVSTGLASVGTKSKTDTETNKFTTENNTDSDREKIQYILDQNIAISKAILKDTATDGTWNLIPIVVSDSHFIIHEGLVQWKEEKNSNSDVGNIQIIYMTIPTENLGNINLVLRSGSSGTRINFKVSTEEVRKYFIKNMTAMKTAISKNALITININQNNDINNDIPGVDLWM